MTIANCSVVPPTSAIYFSEISKGEKVGVGISGGLCAAVIGISVDQAIYVLRKYQTGGDPELKIKTLWLIGIYPVFALMALLAICVPRTVLLADLISAVYLAVCLYHFSSLIILYAGGAAALLSNVESSSNGFSLRTPPCCCCCTFCPVIQATRSNLRKLRLMVLQNVIFQPIISFTTFVLWLDERYVRGEVAEDQAYIYLVVLQAITSLTAVYGLMIFYRNSRCFLKEHNLRLKFIAMKIVIILQSFQDFIFVSLAKKNIPPCSGHLSSEVRSDAIRHMVLVAEMFLLALGAWILYRRPHHHQEEDLQHMWSTYGTAQMQ